jgi:Holliday junction resolvasome RuvABC endonuclease subunit
MIVGVDSAKNRIDAVALLDGKIADWFTMAIPTRKVISRDRTLKDLRFSFNFWLHCLVVPPTLYVEAPLVMNGRQTAVSLAETVGMILSLPYPAELVAIDSWKQVAVGKGGVSKEKVKQAIIELYPATKEIFGERQDLFDATGVAIFGHRSGRTSPATDPA